jgi:DNA-binding NarL/FixJ family response regulator
MAIKIILADDHKLFREGLRRILELQEDLQVVGEAGDGEQVLSLLESRPCDVIIMDINMPKLNGVEATRRVKEKYPRTTVLVLSIHDDREYLLEVLNAGAAGYVLKDIDPDKLIEAIRLVAAGESVVDPGLTARLITELTRLSSKTEVETANPLTEREREVLALMAEGLGNRDIAAKLFVSEKTVKNHVTNIFRKLDVSDRTQAVVQGVKLKLVNIGT